jgi:hypothetical protein
LQWNRQKKGTKPILTWLSCLVYRRSMQVGKKR